MDTDTDWRDGFLFLANQTALDLLNTLPVMEGKPVELLTDAAALRRWLAAAGFDPGLPGDVAQIRDLREDLRKAVFEIEAGKAPSTTFLRDLNARLSAHPFTERIVPIPCAPPRETGLARERIMADAFGAILDATADLLTSADRARIRKCAACALHFSDTSKKGTRRWCSMRICGNRYKVAAYMKRKREEATSESR